MIDVTVVAGCRRQPPGLTVHTSRPLHPEDGTIHGGIPVTSVPRTLLDLAEVVRPTQLQRAYEEAERLQLLDLGAFQRLLARSNGRRGYARYARSSTTTPPPPPGRGPSSSGSFSISSAPPACRLRWSM